VCVTHVSTKRPDTPRTASLSAQRSDSGRPEQVSLPAPCACTPTTCAPALTSFDNSSHHAAQPSPALPRLAPPRPGPPCLAAPPTHTPSSQPAPSTHDSPQPIRVEQHAGAYTCHLPHRVPGAGRGPMETLQTSLFSHLASFLLSAATSSKTFCMMRIDACLKGRHKGKHKRTHRETHTHAHTRESRRGTMRCSCTQPQAVTCPVPHMHRRCQQQATQRGCCSAVLPQMLQTARRQTGHLQEQCQAPCCHRQSPSQTSCPKTSS
jgi:hypothetical protein